MMPKNEGTNTQAARAVLHQYGLNRQNVSLILGEYLSLRSADRTIPRYLTATDIRESHIIRTRQRADTPESAFRDWAVTRHLVTKVDFRDRGGLFLAGVLAVAAISVLKCRLDVSCAFELLYETINCIDDCLDQEDTYAEFGNRLLVISHAYSDLMDMAMCLTLGREEFVNQAPALYAKIRKLLLGIFRGDKVVLPKSRIRLKAAGTLSADFFTPLATVDTLKIQQFGAFVQQLCEVAAILDDIVDYEEDLEKGFLNNYLFLCNLDFRKAIDLAKRRLLKAKSLMEGFGGEQAVGTWHIFNAYLDVVGSSSASINDGRMSGMTSILQRVESFTKELTVLAET